MKNHLYISLFISFENKFYKIVNFDPLGLMNNRQNDINSTKMTEII